MTCETYKEAVIDGAASGGKLEGRLADHLEVCAQCRARLESERWLFAAIDEALRSKVNESPHPGFLAGVRARISEETPASRWSPMLALASAVLAIALLAIAHPWARKPTRSAEAGSLEAPTIRAQQTLNVAKSGTESRKSSELPSQARTPPTKQTVTRRKAHHEPEVLVPPDEAKAFAQFVARLRRRDEVAQAFVSPAVDENNELSQIPPVQIARLQLEPLVWEKWK